MQCRLCLKEKELCNSHIFPEFLYRDLYDANHKLIGITGQGNNKYIPLQKGIREHLFCFDCEQHLNDKYEKPFLKQWSIDSPLPSQMTHDSIFSATYDYLTFKLFHLSILFRSSISSLPTFQEVNLGIHEERMRLMLLNENPGKSWEYPILACVILNGSNVEKGFISQPISVLHDGHMTYGQIYGGAMWWTRISSDKNNFFCSAGLQTSGDIKMIAESWNEIGVVQDASAALKRNDL
jgi:hypothetical protein